MPKTRTSNPTASLLRWLRFQATFIITLVLLISSHIEPSRAQSWLFVYVDPVDGVDSQNCTSSGDESTRCKSLSYAFSARSRDSWVQYVLQPGDHPFVSGEQKFENVTGIILSAKKGSHATVLCGNSSGFSFLNATDVSLSDIEFQGCGVLQASTNRNLSSNGNNGFTLNRFRVGLFFNACKKVSMTRVTVSNSDAGKGVVLYNTVGRNIFTSSSFVRNVGKIDSEVLCDEGNDDGGGLVVEFTYCVPGDNRCLQRSDSAVDGNRDSTYAFFNCTFSSNQASLCTAGVAVPYRSDHSNAGKGGGLSVSFNGNASNNTVQIDNCTFQNNSATYGAGMFVQFGDSAGENSVIVTSSSFEDNWCPLSLTGASGGGMRLENYIYNDSGHEVGSNTVQLNRCRIVGNAALIGGGLSLSSSRRAGSSLRPVQVSISDSFFAFNMAKVGAAVEARLTSVILNGAPPALDIVRCNFTQNSVEYSSSASFAIGSGAVYVKGVPLTFTESVLFSGNSGTALVLIEAAADFSFCNVATFSENRGFNGGAIALQGGASIVTSNRTFLKFYANSASNHGGAVYNRYSDPNADESADCFIHYDDYLVQPPDWGSNFLFVNNTSGRQGSSIFSTSLFPCAIRAKDGGLNLTWAFCWNERWSYGSGSCRDEIASDVGSVEMEASAEVSSAAPGEDFRLPLRLLDDQHRPIQTVPVLAVATANASLSVVERQYGGFLNGSLSMTGLEGSANVVSMEFGDTQVWRASFLVRLTNCPPGMKPDEDGPSSRCVCPALNAYQSSLYCDGPNFQTYLRNGFWLGLDQATGKLLVALCPPSFCYVNESSWAFRLPRNLSQLDETICAPRNRRGTVCGQCIDGYGPAVNSLRYDCVPCPRSDLAINVTKYVFTVYIPLLAFFLVIFLFNVPLTTGVANGFIVFSQVVISTFALHGDYHIPLYTITPHSDRLLKAYQVAYGIFNLETFYSILHPFCLSADLNTLRVLQLSYLVALFPLLMIFGIVLLVGLRRYRCCRCGTLLREVTCGSSGRWIYRKIRFSPLHAFASFLLLSYNRLCLTSTYMVNVQPLKDEYGNRVGSARPYYAQQLVDGSAEYVVEYKLVGAFVLLTFVLIPPFLLLGYPTKWFENYVVARVGCLRRFYPADKVNILLDVFQGCYRNNRRYFASFYFLFRLSVNVAYFMTDTWIDQYNIQVVLCAVMVLLIAVLRPYRRKVLNYVDMAIFIDMLILSLLSIYLYERGDYDPYAPLPVFPYVVQYILVFLPLLGLVGYGLWLFAGYVRRREGGKADKNEDQFDDRSINLENITNGPDFQSSFTVEDLFERAGDGNSYIPYALINRVNNSNSDNGGSS